MQNKITITGKDLSEAEKSEQFAEVFGRSTLVKALMTMSEQVTGDGTLEKLMDLAEPLNPGNEEDAERYEKLRLRMEKESARLVEPEKATFEIEITDGIADTLWSRKDLASSLLGDRFYEALFPNGMTADRQTLQRFNPNLKNKSGESLKEQVEFHKQKIDEAKRQSKKQVDNL